MSANNLLENKGLRMFLKYFAAIVGLAGIVIAFLISFDVLTFDFLEGTTQTFLASLAAAIVGVILVFFAFSKELDQIFLKAEETKFSLSKNEDAAQISVDNIIWFVFAIALLTVKVLLDMNILILPEILGTHTDLIINIILVILIIFCFIQAFWQIIKPALKEMRKVTWTTAKIMKEHSIKVFTFVIFMSLLFLALDQGLTGLKDWFYNNIAL
ncbi:preprotein translocase subunit SecE [Haloplasma contractile]|uniref:SecE/Sec61-gamma subunit of translocation protein n=1 Tax=Haloplasma contractile SSD-17B TaxID=1033810 RepID=U2DVK2_9MOLU|nr:preprotein translocase subunit SecE [Haloplasma contractile]ERJ12402.1 SecE/Sec61-gamma subunit of translocation protein [Haloplasma contractile SSD-17B]